jgi:glucose-6-phosphate-specific signal transduction histidine kinase
MIEPLHPGYAGSKTTTHTASLKSLINHVLRHSLSEMMRRSDSSIMNEIPAELCLIDDENKVEPVIQELLATIVSNARKGRIHIRAERSRDIIILEIHDKSNYNGYALDYSIRSIEPLARSIGGDISIKERQQLETTVAFSFPDRPDNTSYDC